MQVANTAKTNVHNGYVAVWRKEIDGFLNVTAFKALQFVTHAAHWIESIFWVVLLVGATALAIRDVRKVCDAFSSEETFTRMRMKGLQRLTLDDAVICVEYDARSLNISDPQLIEHTNISKIVEFSKRANSSTVDFFSRSLKLVTAIHLIEVGRTADYESKVADLKTGEHLQGLQDWLWVSKVNISDLSGIVGNWLCNSAQMKIDMIKRGTLLSSVNPCEPANISWLGVVPYIQIMTSRTSFCVDVGGKLSFGSVLDRVLVSISSNITGLGDHTLHSIIDFSGDPVSTDMSKDYVTFPSTGCLAFQIGIDAEMHLLDRRVARCEKEAKSRIECYGGCEVSLYKSTKECNCTPLTWKYLYAENRSMCFDQQNIEQHIACRHASKKAPNTMDACWASCPFPCTHKQNVISAIAQGCYEERERQRKDRASIELIPKRFTVPIFEEQFSVSLSELFSSIGGTCGLWLGVGVLGICHALLFPLKLVTKLLVNRYRRVRETNASEALEFAEKF